MERESFEDEATAALMNEHFVCIKVDREERPDVDAIYMEAVHAIAGRGGWPMSVWLTPDAVPFYGGIDSPKNQDVSSGSSGYTETVRVGYDPEVAPLPFLLDLFYKAIDPTSLNRQGNDAGTQYRSGIYYSEVADREVIERSLAQLQTRYNKPIAIEAQPLACYTPAEEYHQDYLDKNPGGYCHIGPRLFEDAAAAVPDPSVMPVPGADSEDTKPE